MSENKKHKMTVKSVAICVVISILIVIVGNTIIYFVSQMFQMPNADTVLAKLQKDGFTDSYIHVDEKYSARSIYVLDEAIEISEINNNIFWIYIKKDIEDENRKNVLISVMRVFDKDFSSYDAEKILNLNEDSRTTKINDVLYWLSFEDGKLDSIEIVL